MPFKRRSERMFISDNAVSIHENLGIALPEGVLRKVYYANALPYPPSVRNSIQKQLAARR